MNPPFGLTQVQLVLIAVGVLALALILLFGGRIWMLRRRDARRVARVTAGAADFLVHPTFYDPCSLVALEALLCGLPVITTRYNGAKELLHPPRDGFVIDDPHDHRALAEAMARLLEPAARAACAQEARRTVEQWDFGQHYRELLEVLAEAAARKQAA